MAKSENNKSKDTEVEAQNNEEAPILEEVKEETSEAAPKSKEQNYEDLKSAHLYLKAEFDNYKKNMIKERSQLVKFGSERIIQEVLSVMDNFYRALEMDVTKENFQTFKEGISMTANDFDNTMKNFGVEELKIDTDTMFDPNMHDALSSEPTDKVKAGYISNVFKKGYKLNGKVIRPAQVVVAREPDVEAEATEAGVIEIDDTDSSAEDAQS